MEFTATGDIRARREDLRRRPIPIEAVRKGMVVMPLNGRTDEIGTVVEVGVTIDGEGTCFTRRLVTGPRAGELVRMRAWPDQYVKITRFYLT